MKNNNVLDWLVEFDIPPYGGQQDPTSGGTAPTTDPYQNTPQGGGNPNIGNEPNQMNTDPGKMDTQPKPEDISKDPQHPHMPEEKPHHDDFEVWKSHYFKESIKGDTQILMDLLSQVRDRENLSDYQEKFIEDNWNVQLLRQDSNINKASKEIRQLVKDQLDKNNPATSIVNHIKEVLDQEPLLNNIFIKMKGYMGQKGDLHRKYIAALLGAVQVGTGANTEDIIYNEREYSIKISTRFNARWGEVALCNWALKESDPERFLSSPEVKRLQEGSPEEKEALRHRIVIESIAQQLETRAFIINVTGDDGTIYSLGWDIATSLRSAFAEGKLVVKVSRSEASEALFADTGELTVLEDISIMYSKETGEQDENGMPAREELEFISRKNGMLVLNATRKVIKEATTNIQGMSYKETPYTGNPSDLKILKRCVYSTYEMLLRQCGG